jgi:hypothetical protein
MQVGAKVITHRNVLLANVEMCVKTSSKICFTPESLPKTLDDMKSATAFRTVCSVTTERLQPSISSEGTQSEQYNGIRWHVNANDN